MYILNKKRNYEPYWYIAPALIITIVVLVLPLIYAIVLSFFQWDLVRPDLGVIFVGINNYIKVITSDSFQNAFYVTLFFTTLLVIFELFFGMGIALLLQCQFWGRGIIRSLVFLPMMITPVVAGLVFKSILFNTNFGLVNYFLNLIGIEQIDWFIHTGTARFVILLTSLWCTMPMTVLILLAGLEALPMDIYEAASIDGASSIQKFRLITLPLMKQTVLVAIIFRTIFSLRIFDIPTIATAGGPGATTKTLSMLAHEQSTQFFRMGIGSSTAIIILIISIIFAIAYLRIIKID